MAPYLRNFLPFILEYKMTQTNIKAKSSMVKGRHVFSWTPALPLDDISERWLCNAQQYIHNIMARSDYVTKYNYHCLIDEMDLAVKVILFCLGTIACYKTKLMSWLCFISGRWHSHFLYLPNVRLHPCVWH